MTSCGLNWQMTCGALLSCSAPYFSSSISPTSLAEGSALTQTDSALSLLKGMTTCIMWTHTSVHVGNSIMHTCPQTCLPKHMLDRGASHWSMLLCSHPLNTPTKAQSSLGDGDSENFSFPVTPPSEPVPAGPVFGHGFGRASSGVSHGVRPTSPFSLHATMQNRLCHDHCAACIASQAHSG